MVNDDDIVEGRYETTDPDQILTAFPKAAVEADKKKIDTDSFMNHFMNQTWKVQGPDFEQNTWMNLQANRIRPDTMYTALPPVDTDTVLIVGAGPSLEKNIALLHEVPDNWVVVCTDRALKQCLLYRDPYIVANLEATIEAMEDVQMWWRDVPTERLRLLTVPQADPDLFNLWKGKYYFINTLLTSRQLLRLAGKIQWKTGVRPFVTGTNVGVTSCLFGLNFLHNPALNKKAKDKMRIVMLGMDHVVYEPTKEVNLNLNDVNGRDACIPWNYFIGQFEVRFLAQESRPVASFINCTEGGILYSKDIYKMTFKQLLEEGVHGEPEDTYADHPEILKELAPPSSKTG